MKLRIALLILTGIFGVANYSISASGYSYLQIPHGARETAMGETGVSHALGAASVWWNPALTAREPSDVWFQAFRWFADGKGSFGAVKIATGWGGIGAYFMNFGWGGFEARDRPGPAQATFALHQTVIAAGAGVGLTDDLKLGLVYKATFDDIYGDRHSNYGIIDLGGVWTRGRLAVGMTTANLGGANNVDPLPSRAVFGASYKTHSGGFDLTPAAETVMMENEAAQFHLGFEAGWQRAVFVRAGYMTGHDSSSPVAGFGAVHGRYRADFSYTPYRNSLGEVWRFGIGMGI